MFAWTAQTKIKIRNITDSTDVIIGATGYTSSANSFYQVPYEVSCRVTIASAKAFALQYRAGSTAGGTQGLGSPANYGVVEVYAEVEIWREA